jgi:hypothetical protein
MKGTFTFAVGRASARTHQFNRHQVVEIGEDRFAVTIPVEFDSIKDVQRIVNSVADDVETFTIKDDQGVVQWTEEDFE